MRGRAGDLFKSFRSEVSREARVEYNIEERTRDLPQDLSRKGAGTPVQIGIVDSCRGGFLLKRFAVDRHTACTVLRCNSRGAAAVVLVGSGVSRVLKGLRWNVKSPLVRPMSLDQQPKKRRWANVGNSKDASSKKCKECWSCRVLEGLDSGYVRKHHPFSTGVNHSYPAEY